MVGPECKELHWNQINTVKTIVSIIKGHPIGNEPTEGPRELMEKMDADILFACVSKEFTFESSTYRRIQDITDFEFDVEVWVRAEKFCSIITSGYEDKIQEAVELSPIIKIGDLKTHKTTRQQVCEIVFEWTKFYGIVFPDECKRNGIIEAFDLNEQEFAIIPNSFDDWNEKILSPFKVNVKRILFQEEFIVKMKTMEFIYCDPIINAITGENYNFEDNLPGHSFWEAQDNERLRDEYWAEQEDYSHDVYCDAVLEINALEFLPNLKYEKKGIEEYDGLEKRILQELEQCFRDHMENLHYWYDDGENLEYFNQRICFYTASNLAKKIGQCIGKITKHMPEKPEIKLNNLFEGLQEENKYWSWVKQTGHDDYFGFGDPSSKITESMIRGTQTEHVRNTVG